MAQEKIGTNMVCAVDTCYTKKTNGIPSLKLYGCGHVTGLFSSKMAEIYDVAHEVRDRFVFIPCFKPQWDVVKLAWEAAS